MQQNLKILIVSRSLPFHHLGGMEAVAWDLARALKQQGATVTVLTTACASLGKHYATVDGVGIHLLDAPPGRYSRAWWKESKRVFEDRYADNVDVVLSISAGARTIATSASRGSTPFVFQAHGTAWGEFVSKLRQSSIIAKLGSVMNLVSMVRDLQFRSFQAGVAVGEAVEKDMRRSPTRWILGKTSVLTIVNGVSSELFEFDEKLRNDARRELGVDENSTVVVSASRLHAQKGILEGIKGFLAAAENDASLHYVVVGAGPDEQRLRAFTEASAYRENIHFVGYCPRHKMKRWLSTADIFLFTTKRVEGLPLNILEASAAGLPIIASEHVCDPRLTCVSVDPSDATAIGDAILSAARPSKVNRKSNLPTEFTIQESAKSYMSLFYTLINRTA